MHILSSLILNFCFFLQVIQFSEDNNLPPKALLLVDNCSAHAPIDKLQSEDGNIIAYFLPPNVTAAVQPMDQNPIKLTKLIYRKKLLSQLIGDVGDIDKLLKRYSIRDAIILLKQAWDEITQAVLKNSWSKLLNWDSGDYDSDDDLPLAQLAQQNEDCNEVLQLNLNLLNEIMPNNSVTVNEIEEWNEDVFTGGSNAENSDEEASDSSDVDIVDITPAIPHSKVLEGINNVIKWCKTSDIFSSKHMSNLLDVRNDIVVSSLNKSKKQTSITDFMSKNN